MEWARAWERAPQRRRALAGTLIVLLALQVVVMEVVLATRGAMSQDEAPQQMEHLQALASQARGRPVR